MRRSPTKPGNCQDRINASLSPRCVITFCSSASDRQVASSSLRADLLSGAGQFGKEPGHSPVRAHFPQVLLSRRKKRNAVSQAKWR